MIPFSLDWMAGKRIGEIQFVEPVSWWFKFDGDGAIRVEALWRVVDPSGVRVTNQDHGQRFGLEQPVDAAARATAALGNRIVKGARIAAATGDLLVECENGSRLEILTTSAGFESWSISFPNGDEATALGGGRVAFQPK